MKGAVAAGSEAAVDAGLYALRKGGNAIDAVIAAQLSATVSEPLLTGLMGAGIGIIYDGHSASSIDMFSTHPGLGHYRPCDVDNITINFGPTSQDFSIGLGSIATPSLWKGILELHHHANLPLEVLAEPAIRAAKSGIHVNHTLAFVLDILWPICSYSPDMRSMFTVQGRNLREGDLFYCHQAAADIQALIQHREDFLLKGRVGDQLWPFLEERSSLTRADILNYRVQTREARTVKFSHSEVMLPNAPSIGSEFVARNLNKVTHNMSKLDLIRIQESTCSEIDQNVLQEIFLKSNGSTAKVDLPEISAGFTSHISVVDEEGWAAGLTSSLGESCGYMIPGTGLILNNFLGEDDVCPQFIRGNAGKRLMTMCTPTIVKTADDLTVMGSGGSTRIRTAILHGILDILQSDRSLEQAIRKPRIHVEPKLIQLELHDQPKDLLLRIQSQKDFQGHKIEFFDEPSMFFGGLHTAQRKYDKNGQTFQAHGDPRRDGVGKVT